MELNIITAVSRPGNLSILKDNIQKEVCPYFDVKWYCVYDPGKNLQIIQNEEPWIVSICGGKPNDCAGGSQRNVALDMITNGWIYCLDDDNILYEYFGKIMLEKINQHKNVQGFIFNQKRYSGRIDLLAKQENVRIGYIDMAQFLAKKEIIENIRFAENLYQSDCDFIFRVILNQYSCNPQNIMFIDEFLCHYNYLSEYII